MIRPAGDVIGVLVTFRRMECLPKCLAAITQQSLSLRRLVVVDNGNCNATRQIVAHAADRTEFNIECISPKTNLGSAGGWAFGMDFALANANEHDWILPLDDDNPPLRDTDFEAMLQFAADMRARRLRLAAVGIVGARMDWKRGTLARLRDRELHGPVDVDVLGSGHLPLYSVAALRDIGGFDPQLFFGMSEVELGLRFKRAGYQLVAHGDMWRERRRETDAAGRHERPFGKCKDCWRSYYVTRNYIYMMLKFGRPDLACRRAVRELLLKPILTTIWHVEPGTAIRSSWLALKAVKDGFLCRMGRTIEPDLTSPVLPQLREDVGRLSDRR